MTNTDEKGFKSTPGDFGRNSDAQLGDAHDLQDLTLLGYKPELRRNRSMFTLLFQSLAIAAVSVRRLIILTSGSSYYLSADPVRLRQPFDQCHIWRR